MSVVPLMSKIYIVEIAILPCVYLDIDSVSVLSGNQRIKQSFLLLKKKRSECTAEPAETATELIFNRFAL